MCSQEGFKDAFAHVPMCLAQAVPGPVEGVPSLIFPLTFRVADP